MSCKGGEILKYQIKRLEIKSHRVGNISHRNLDSKGTVWTPGARFMSAPQCRCESGNGTQTMNGARGGGRRSAQVSGCRTPLTLTASTMC